MFFNHSGWQGQAEIIIRLTSNRSNFNLKTELDSLGYDTFKPLKAVVIIELGITLDSQTDTGALVSGSFTTWVVEGAIEGQGGNGGGGQSADGNSGPFSGSAALDALIFQCDGGVDLSSGGHVYAGANGGGGAARYCCGGDDGYGGCGGWCAGADGAGGYGNPNGSGNGVRGTWGEGVAIKKNGHSVTIINQTASTVKGSVS
jgi:hypothetical protein